MLKQNAHKQVFCTPVQSGYDAGLTMTHIVKRYEPCHFKGKFKKNKTGEKNYIKWMEDFKLILEESLDQHGIWEISLEVIQGTQACPIQNRNEDNKNLAIFPLLYYEELVGYDFEKEKTQQNLDEVRPDEIMARFFRELLEEKKKPSSVTDEQEEPDIPVESPYKTYIYETSLDNIPGRSIKINDTDSVELGNGSWTEIRDRILTTFKSEES